MGTMNEASPLLEASPQEVNNDRFKRARGRQFDGFDRRTEGSWKGSYSFVQMADTQFGLLSGMKAVQWMRRINALTCGLTKRCIPIPEDANAELSSEQAYQLEVDFT